MAPKEYEIGQKVEWVHEGGPHSRRYGEGPFVVAAMENKPNHLKKSTGHSEWLEIARLEVEEGQERQLHWDRATESWVGKEELSDLGRTQPIKLSGSWLKPVVEE